MPLGTTIQYKQAELTVGLSVCAYHYHCGHPVRHERRQSLCVSNMTPCRHTVTSNGGRLVPPLTFYEQSWQVSINCIFGQHDRHVFKRRDYLYSVPARLTSVTVLLSNTGIHRVKWRHSSLWSHKLTISMLWGNTAAYCVKLSGEHLSRYSNKTESVGFLNVPIITILVRKRCHNNTIICLGVNRHLVSGHEISSLHHGLQLIMSRYTRIINCKWSE